MVDGRRADVAVAADSPTTGSPAAGTAASRSPATGRSCYDDAMEIDTWPIPLPSLPPTSTLHRRKKQGGDGDSQPSPTVSDRDQGLFEGRPRVVRAEQTSANQLTGAKQTALCFGNGVLSAKRNACWRRARSLWDNTMPCRAG